MVCFYCFLWEGEGFAKKLPSHLSTVILPRSILCDGSNPADPYCRVTLETPSTPLKPNTTYEFSVRSSKAVDETDFSDPAGKFFMH